MPECKNSSCSFALYSSYDECHTLTDPGLPPVPWMGREEGSRGGANLFVDSPHAPAANRFVLAGLPARLPPLPDPFPPTSPLPPPSPSLATQARPHAQRPVDHRPSQRAHAALTFIDNPQLVRNHLDEALVVRHENNAPFELVERHRQRLDRLEVQVVGRLVEQQDVRRAPRQLRECQPRLLTAREEFDRIER
eukprot:scaffold17472_cov105-Isochrysis_galbana.AAC.4